jgi:hypothetical protein
MARTRGPITPATTGAAAKAETIDERRFATVPLERKRLHGTVADFRSLCALGSSLKDCQRRLPAAPVQLS